MAITFNPQLKMTSNVTFKRGETSNAKTAESGNTPINTAISTPVNPKEKKSAMANFASKVAYGWINLSESVKGTVKGAFAAAVVGTTIAGVDTVISGVKKKEYKAIFTNPTKAMGTVGKVVAPIVSAAVFAGYVVSARLNANKRTANVDHQLYTNHRAKA